jgi:seryl-tRNA synthetase
MLSIDFIRNNKDQVQETAVNKNRPFDIDKLLELDDRRKELMTEAQELRQKRNELAKQGNVEAAREEGKRIKEDLKGIEAELEPVEKEFNTLMLFVPNVVLDEVPVGKDESGNKEIKTWGTIPQFNFTPKSHSELAESLQLIDMERGSKISGFRGYFLMNELAVLQVAIMQYAFMKLVGKGYTPVLPPAIVKEFTLFGSAHFPWGRAEDVYQLNQDSDAYLAGTAEIPVTALHSDEILNEKDLPKKFVAMSPCYRREAGAYGKDTKGILRVHEFWKIEQVIIARNDIDEARKLHEELQQNTEEIFQDLELPYHVLLMCTGDMGEPQMLKYDTEVWIPSENAYREVASNSIMGDFQARRLKIRYKKDSGEIEYCYTLNDTAIASTRPLIAILEHNQQEDGSVKVPKVLQPLVGFDTIKPH